MLVCVAKCEADLNGGQPDAGKVAAAVAAADRAGGTYWPVKSRQFLASQAPPEIGEPLLAEALQIAERTSLDDFAAAIRGDTASLTQFRGDSTTVLAAWQDVVDAAADPIASSGSTAASMRSPRASTPPSPTGSGSPSSSSSVSPMRRSVGRPRRRSVSSLTCVPSPVISTGPTRRSTHSPRRQPEQNFLGGLSIITRSALWRQRGKPGRAATTIVTATYHIGFRGITDIAMRVLEELAAVAVDLDQPQRGADLLATADQARRHEHKPRSPACAVEVDAVRARVAAWRGTPLDIGDAVAVADRLASATRSTVPTESVRRDSAQLVSQASTASGPTTQQATRRTRAPVG